MLSVNRVRVKFCGMTNVEDAFLAAELGADAIGLIFHAESPRHIGTKEALEICQHLPPFIAKVGVFVDQSAEFVANILKMVPLDALQFHGKEPHFFCRSFNKPYIKAIAVGDEKVSRDIEELYHDAAALMFDTAHRNLPGGTGQAFDWTKLPTNLNKPFILAGGLTVDNVTAALSSVKPYAIDVVSGVEHSKGLKDPEKMKFFMNAVMDYYRRTYYTRSG